MSKAARAIEIYNEELALGNESLRKRCIARYKSELAMKDAGAGTYFQNTKKKMEAGGATPQLTLSPKPQAKTTAAKTAPSVAATPRWSRFVVEDGIVTVVECYTTKEDMLAAFDVHGGQFTEEPAVIKVGDVRE